MLADLGDDPAFEALLERIMKENEVLQVENEALRQTLLAVRLVLDSCDVTEEDHE
jgi:regulator of replication initiation timing